MILLSSETCDAIWSANDHSYLGDIRPTGNWAMDNLVGSTIMKQVIEHSKEDGGATIGWFLQELATYGPDWRGIAVGVYEELAKRVVRR